MALLNFANTYAEISGNLSLPESNSGDFVKLFFSKDGHIITHGKDFTPTFTPNMRGLVPTSSGKATEIFRGNATWAEIAVTDLPIASSVSNAIDGGTASTTILNTQLIVDYVSNAFASNDAMRFKGTIKCSNGNYTTHTVAGAEVLGFPTKCEVGDTYRVASEGTYAGLTCSAGDLLICIQDGTGSSLNTADYWTAIEANINGEVKHTVNGTSFYVYSRSTNAFTIYAPTTSGTLGLILLSNGSSAPEWADLSTLVVKEAGKVSNALSLGAGLTFGTSGVTYDGSVARTVSLSPATVSTLGGVFVDKDSTNKTISVTTAGSIYLTKQNIINALGYTPGNAISEKTYTYIITSDADSTTAVSANTTNPYINLLQTQNGSSTVVSSFQVTGIGKISVTGKTALSISLNEADASNYGGIKIGYNSNGKNYAVQLSNGLAYVNVPWTTPGLATSTSDGLVPKFDAVGSGSISNDSWILAKLANGTYDWFSLPSTAFLNTWRGINVNNSQLLGTGTTTGNVNFTGGGKTTVSGDKNGTITVTSTWRTITIGGTSIEDSALNFVPSGDVYLKTDSTEDGVQDISFGLSWFNISANNGQGAYETA